MNDSLDRSELWLDKIETRNIHLRCYKDIGANETEFQTP